MSHTEHQESAQSIVARCAVLTCSDTRTPETDYSGSYIVDQLREAGHKVAEYALIPDDPLEIQTRIRAFNSIDVIIVNGGTGISKRDNTFSAVQDLISPALPGFGELFRMLSYKDIGSAAMLSRATAGLMNATIVFSLPGSKGAVRLAMQELILPQIRHLVFEIRK